jgi:FeS assembly SUF system protein
MHRVEGEAMSKISEWWGKPPPHGDKVDTDALKEKVIAALRGVYDPEIPVNIYDLGLIYQLTISEQGYVDVEMTLTAPGCPVAQSFPATVEDAVSRVEGVSEAKVELVWDPPWTQDRMTDEVKLQLGLL